jgi:hypothetical protein
MVKWRSVKKCSITTGRSYLPEKVVEQLQKSAKQHYRSFNGELIFAVEQYLTYWREPANKPPQP